MVSEAVDGFLEDVETPAEIAPNVRAMLTGECIHPLASRLAGTLVLDPRLSPSG
ncbi:MAG: hypothetical protein JWO26_537, partial [Rhodospirillales bacterium]|nr:hypothetical protein [Rhodospirillales bacterium]